MKLHGHGQSRMIHRGGSLVRRPFAWWRPGFWGPI